MATGGSALDPPGRGRLLLGMLAVAGLLGSLGFPVVSAALGLASPGYDSGAALVE